MRRDRAQRIRIARVDDRARQSKVLAARRIIYEENYAVDCVAVQNLLRNKSLVPTVVRLYIPLLFLESSHCGLQNAFSEKLGPLGFNLFKIFVVDFMHEVELGDWRSLFIHLLRVLDSLNCGLLNELDRR
jgi:hypothetical protein